MVRRQMAPRPLRQRGLAEARHYVHAHRHGKAFRSDLHGGHERRLAWAASTGRATVALTAPVGIVQLNDASQRLGIIALDHGLHQLVPWGLPLVVLDQPGGVGVDAQLPAQAQGRDAVLVLGQQVDRQEVVLNRRRRVTRCAAASGCARTGCRRSARPDACSGCTGAPGDRAIGSSRHARSAGNGIRRASAFASGHRGTGPRCRNVRGKLAGSCRAEALFNRRRRVNWISFLAMVQPSLDQVVARYDSCVSKAANKWVIR